MITEAIVLAAHSYLNKEFRKGFKNLPPQIQDIATKKYKRWRADHRTLNFEPKFSNIFAVEITRSVHAICEIIGRDVYWFWVGNYEEYTSLLNALRKGQPR